MEPSAIGVAFIGGCVKQGWLIQRGEEYFASKEGIGELGARFEITIKRAQRR